MTLMRNVTGGSFSSNNQSCHFIQCFLSLLCAFCDMYHIHYSF